MKKLRIVDKINIWFSSKTSDFNGAKNLKVLITVTGKSKLVSKIILKQYIKLTIIS